VLQGISGRLLSRAFLEAHLQASEQPLIVEAHRRLADWHRRALQLGPSASLTTLLDTGAVPLMSMLGFEPPASIRRTDQRICATIAAAGGAAALIVVSWGEPLDRFWRAAVVEAMRRDTVWAFVFNGTRLRIVDARRLFSRRWTEFHVEAAAEDLRTAAALWAVCRSSMFSDGTGEAAIDVLVRASDDHAAGVCRSLRDGVHLASAEVLAALTCRRPVGSADVDVAHEQALTIVYRILFLLFAEARSLVPVWHPVYRESYTIQSLRAAAETPGGATGLWDALRAIGRLAHAGCRAGDLTVTPFNGRLFAPAGTPLADRADLDDDYAARAVLALATRPSPAGGGREAIAYRDLGVEQLGAVYETLLDDRPKFRGRPAGQPHRADTVPIGRFGDRKGTGTFYTPLPIAEYVVRETLGPLVRDRAPDEILQLRIVDPAMGSGAFLVCACRYLAAAYEDAMIRSGACHPADIDEGVRAGIRRSIAERCLYGVDVNPMAVQLARLSLWLTTLSADRPLTFLDHRLLVGDSLIGAWLHSIRRPPVAIRLRRRPPVEIPLFGDDVGAGAVRDALPSRFFLESSPDDTLEQVQAKERTLAAVSSRDGVLARWKRIANLWCASWLLPHAIPPNAFGALCDAILTGHCALPPKEASRHLSIAEATAARARVFHWELEFPEVFFGADGRRRERAGFDAVLGNPPWDMLRADSGPDDTRQELRTRIAAVVRFVRNARVYDVQQDGHINRYQLFVERAAALARPAGRLGLVLPSGFATDHGNAALRRRMLTHCGVEALVGIDNRQGVFPIHRSVRFLLLTASCGAPTRSIACRFGITDPAELESADAGSTHGDWYPVRLTPDLLHRVSGRTLSIPLWATPVDVAIAERAASLFPPLGSQEGWGARFGRELNATEDRRWFTLPPGGLPIVEGKQIEPFHVAVDRSRHAIAGEAARRLLPDCRYERPRLCYRDVSGATNRLTLIAAVLPARCVSVHTVLCLRTRLSATDQHFLCALFNSFVINYFVRFRVSTHVTAALVEQLPIPTRDHAPSAHREIAGLAATVARTGTAEALHRIQAHAARLYQLSAVEFEHVLASFPLVPIEERQAALRSFTTES
jgi:hypothetical protein